MEGPQVQAAIYVRKRGTEEALLFRLYHRRLDITTIEKRLRLSDLMAWNQEFNDYMTVATVKMDVAACGMRTLSVDHFDLASYSKQAPLLVTGQPPAGRYVSKDGLSMFAHYVNRCVPVAPMPKATKAAASEGGSTSTTPHSTHRNVRQKDRKDALAYAEAHDGTRDVEGSGSREYLDVVLGAFLPEGGISLQHCFPLSIRMHVRGSGLEHVSSEENLMLLYKGVHDAIDQGRMALFPTGTGKEKRDVKVVVLDPSLMDVQISSYNSSPPLVVLGDQELRTFGDLHGKVRDFSATGVSMTLLQQLGLESLRAARQRGWEGLPKICPLAEFTPDKKRFAQGQVDLFDTLEEENDRHSSSPSHTAVPQCQLVTPRGHAGSSSKECSPSVFVTPSKGQKRPPSGGLGAGPESSGGREEKRHRGADGTPGGERTRREAAAASPYSKAQELKNLCDHHRWSNPSYSYNDVALNQKATVHLSAAPPGLSTFTCEQGHTSKQEARQAVALMALAKLKDAGYYLNPAGLKEASWPPAGI